MIYHNSFVRLATIWY